MDSFRTFISHGVRSTLLITCSVMTLTAWSQQKNNYDVETTNTIIGIRTGLWIPIGRLARTFDPSPSYEVVIGERGGDISFRYVNLYCIFTLPKGEAFKFYRADTTVSTKSNLILMTGFRWRQEERLSEGSYFDFVTTYLGVGVAGFFLDYKNEEGSRRSFSNVHWHVGWTFSKRVFNNQFIGITGQYNLVPQRGLRDYVGRGFGNTSINIGLEYRF